MRVHSVSVPAHRFIVSGLVHGVFFRATTQQKALELGLTGWVKNCDDGSVEIHAEGPEDKLKELEEWCWKGSKEAKVQNVLVESINDKKCSEFRILK